MSELQIRCHVKDGDENVCDHIQWWNNEIMHTSQCFQYFCLYEIDQTYRLLFRFPMLSPLSTFRSLPRLCPHQSHLHTISGLSGLAPKHGYRCSRCAQRKWPPVLIPPLDSLKDPLKPPQSLILPSLDTPTDQQKSPLLGGVYVDTHHTQTIVPKTVPDKVDGSETKERKEGELTVLSVGRWVQLRLLPPRASAFCFKLYRTL